MLCLREFAGTLGEDGCPSRMSQHGAFRTSSSPGREALEEEVFVQHAELEHLRADAVGRPAQRRWMEWLAAGVLGALLSGGALGLMLQAERKDRALLFASMASGAIPLRPEAGEERCLLRFERPSNSPFPRARVSCGVNLFDAEVYDLGTRFIDDRTDDGDGTLLVDFEDGIVELDGARFLMERGEVTPSRETQDRLVREHRVEIQ
jgi:hypothetical protein